MKGPVQIAKLLDQARQIDTAWAENPNVVIGPMTLDEFRAVKAEMEAVHTSTEAKSTEITGDKNRRHDTAKKLAQYITRVRSGFRAAFGPDSPQYEQVGCTRVSLRKPTGRTGSTATQPSVISTDSTK